MAISKLLRGSLPGVVLHWAARLRFPGLLLFTALVFIADVLIPDVIPFADEIVIGLATLLLANLKKPAEPQESSANDENADES